ncbi:MAG: response regulator transcription factor [Flavobacteriales bacterium]|nr:response regulator transcription factor [Flavobacteriales bacterium]
MINLILADDHQLIIDGISGLLENEADISIVATCNNGLEVLEKLPELRTDLLLLDLDMPEMNGLQCAEEVQKHYPNIKIAILTMHQEKTLIKKFIEFGVKGYFLKTIPKDELIQAIKIIANGGEYFPADVTKALLQKQRITPNVTQNALLAELTEREIEIIKAVSQGLTNKEIAEKLFISPRTADTHRTNIMRKLDLHNVAEIVRFAFQNKLVE